MKPGSASLLTLQLALTGAAAAGATTELLDIRELDLPMFRPEIEHTPTIKRLIESVYSAQGLIWSSPVYHGSVTGAFKNVLDWLELLADHQPAYLTNKVVGLISTAGGMQGLQAINTMEHCVRALRGFTFPLTVPLDRAWQAFDEAGHIRDEKLLEKLRVLGREVAQTAERLSRPL